MTDKPRDLAALVDQILKSSPVSGGQAILPWPGPIDRERYRLRLAIEPIDSRGATYRTPVDKAAKGDVRSDNSGTINTALILLLADISPWNEDSIERISKCLVQLKAASLEEYERLIARIKRQLHQIKDNGNQILDVLVSLLKEAPERLGELWATYRRPVSLILAAVVAAALVGAPLAALAIHDSVGNAIVEEAIKALIAATAAEIARRKLEEPENEAAEPASPQPAGKEPEPEVEQESAPGSFDPPLPLINGPVTRGLSSAANAAEEAGGWRFKTPLTFGIEQGEDPTLRAIDEVRKTMEPERPDHGAGPGGLSGGPGD